MGNVARKWLPLPLIAAVIAATAVVVRDLPVTVPIDLRGLLPFPTEPRPDSAPKWVAVLAMPALATLIWALFQLLGGPAGMRMARFIYRDMPEALAEAATIERFRATYDTIAFWVVVLVLGVHAGMIASALGHEMLAPRMIAVVMGISLAAAGNVMPRLRPNLVAGVRTPATLRDPQLWRATHRVLGAGFVVAGLATAVVGLLAPAYGLMTAVVGLVAACIIGVAAGRRAHSLTTALVLGVVAAASDEASAQVVTLAPPAGVVEQPYSFRNGDQALEGTLTMPAQSSGAIPVALIVAGSGPTDRNGNGPLVNTNAYAMLAWALAEQGVASVRYDKRGLGASARPGGDPTRITLDSFVVDVGAGAKSLEGDARFSRVYLLGHSEGAGLVLQAANRGAPAAGVIMISAQGRQIAELLHEQFSRQLDSATVTRIDSAFARYLRGEPTGDVHPAAMPVLVPAYRNFMRSWAAYDPQAEARRFRGPLLILQGSTDVQTTTEDAKLIAAAQPTAALVLLDGVNHVLKQVPATDIPPQQKSYADPRLPLAPGVADTIARWLARTTSASGAK